MRRACVVALVIFAAMSAATRTQTRPGALTIESLLDIRHPSNEIWSPRGDAIAFLWDRGGVQNIYVVPADGGTPRAVTSFSADLIDSVDWDRDGRSLIFVRGGQLMRVARDGGTPEPVWRDSATVSDVALSLDGTRAAFVRNGDLYVRPLEGGPENRLTTDLGGASGPIWSPDGTRIAFVLAKSRTVNEDAPYAGAKVVFTLVDRDPGKVAVIPVSGGVPDVFGSPPSGSEAPRWLDNDRLVMQAVSEDLRSRDVIVADARRFTERPLHTDHDPKFWSLTYLGAEPIPSPDGKWVAYVSDADGWDHLYVAGVDGSAPVQVTRGRFEVARFAWSPDSTRIAFDRNDAEHPGNRHLAVATLAGTWGKAKVDTITTGRGTNTNAHWSPDGGRLLFEHTDPHNSADLYVVVAPGRDAATDGSAAATPRRLTDSMPPSIDRTSLVEPQFVRYRAQDGSEVPAYLFAPPGLDRTRTHPAIVWVHGDGINQNYDGWHIHRDYGVYYSVHQFLLQQGYIVLAVDYRGSIGYGRDWREGDYRDLGGKDYQDIASGVEYLKSLGYVDVDRVGIWGLSYGGFMALQALTVTPDLFRCAIDVAGVEDWNDWYRDPGGPWIRGRMGRPQDAPELYRRLSPIYHVDKISRPLLVLHGTSDVNVPFLESVRLLDATTKAGKSVQFMMYPGEFHYFHRAHVLRDAWQKAARFFDDNLKR